MFDQKLIETNINDWMCNSKLCLNKMTRNNSPTSKQLQFLLSKKQHECLNETEPYRLTEYITFCSLYSIIYKSL